MHMVLPSFTKADVDMSHRKFFEFCKGAEVLFGSDCITSNMYLPCTGTHMIVSWTMEAHSDFGDSLVSNANV